MAYGMLTPGLDLDPPSSLIAGEDLLARIFNAIRASESSNGSNHLDTTLLVTFDEHGGTDDHVPPPPAVPPDPSVPAGQFGFTFDRSGVRLPALAISAWIPERTVVTEEHRATSLLATMRERWDLGDPFTPRDASAARSSRCSPSRSHGRRRTGPTWSPARCPDRPNRSLTPH